MSGGGDVRVLRQEAGQESPRMPAWKREILERRKAKGGGSVGSIVAPEPTSPSGGGSQRLNGEPTGNVNGSGGGLKRDGGATGGSGRNYTITSATQHFSNNKESRQSAAERTASREEDGRESLVLQESLGPLEENPFIKLEKERRRRQDRGGNAARPVQHILELYGSVPGIRTIRAENIIIIESDPDYFPEAGGVKAGASWQQNGVDGYSSLNDLLDRRGSSVTEIRAKEVVIYDTTLSKSEENLSTLGRPDPDVPGDAGEGQGRVSRILQKFDSNYGKLQKKSHSTENLLDLDCSASSRPRHWSKTQPDLVPKPRPGPSVSSQPASPVFQSSWSSKPKPQPAVSELGSPQSHPGAQQSVSSFRQRFEDRGVNGAAVTPRDEPDRGQNKLTRERDWEAADAPPKPKVPCSPETRSARAESSLLPVSSKVLRSSPEFEIRPSVKPDLNQIPDGDTQARALANLRLQSRNSFTVVPKRRPQSPSSPSSPAPPDPVKTSPSHRAAGVPSTGSPTSHFPKTTKRKDEKPERKEPEPPSAVATSPTPLPTSEPLSPTPVSTPAPSFTAVLASPPSSPPFSPIPQASFAPPPSPAAPDQPTVDQLPITNIDDVEVEPPERVPVPSPMVQKKKGNTFTVVPKRSTEPQKSSPEPQLEASSETPPGSASPQPAPFAQLGTQLKKRYPAVEEIEVIGGYLSLAKSCLSKTSSEGKKHLQISFNESSLQSTYEYPSESTVWDSEDEEEEDKRDVKLMDDQPSMVGRIHIPRPSLTHMDNGNDLSSYVPKHSVDFSAWQENKHGDSVRREDVGSPQITEEVMLTPVDSSSLSDYSSEPALYF
uniref:Taperin n=1 Tax=Iconisemion striatum TaxID=60296 RepID=A0A1A7YNK6_9TELE